MIALSIAPLTKAAFAPFGRWWKPQDVKPKLINEGFAERFDGLANIDVAAEVASQHQSVHRRCKASPIVIKLMERHPLGSQLFMPLNESLAGGGLRRSGRPLKLPGICCIGATGRELRAKLLAPSAARHRGRQSVPCRRP
jgi:hypothetical protein